MSQATFCISYKSLLWTGKCTQQQMDAWDAAQRAKAPPRSQDFSVADNHTNETQISSAQKHHLSSAMVISRLIFIFSPQNCCSHRTAPTQTPKMCALEKRIFPYSRFERVIFLFIFLEWSGTHSWKILIQNFESFEKFFNNWLN